MGGQQGGGQAPPFDTQYKCFSVAMVDKAHLESGDKIVLPASALDQLTRRNIEFPMLFQLSNGDNKTHSGVMEFSAEEGKCYVPHWMMQVRTNVSPTICTSRGNDVVCVAKCRRAAVQCRSTAVSLCRRMGTGGKYTRCPRSSPSLFPPLPPSLSLLPPPLVLACVQNLLLTEGQLLRVRNVSLPKATFLKLRPQVKEYNESIPESGRCLPFPLYENGATVCLSFTHPQPLVLSSSHPLYHSPTLKPSTPHLTHPLPLILPTAIPPHTTHTHFHPFPPISTIPTSHHIAPHPTSITSPLPQSTDFLEISNHKAVLEKSLRSFSCVTKGDQICFPYNGRQYVPMREVVIIDGNNLEPCTTFPLKET